MARTSYAGKLAAIILASGVLLTLPVVGQEPPYSRSPIIEGVNFDFSTHRRLAPGSDNWPITWADDGHLYTAWGDGGGFDGTNTTGRVKLGVARIEGGGIDYSGKNLWGGYKSTYPAQFDGKSYGILRVDGGLFMWVAGQPARHMESSTIAYSVDHGAHWKLVDWKFTFEEGLSVPTYLNFGQDYAGARDSYVYSYLIEPMWGPKSLPQTTHGFDVHRPGRIHLARVPRGAITERKHYEFFAGYAPDGSPTWSSEVMHKRPVFEDPNGVGWNVSVIHNAGLNRYMLCTEHLQSHAGKLGLFDAPEPWGPWTTVTYENAWGDGKIEVSTFFWNFSQKWMSNNGCAFTMIFTGKHSNDSWNTINGEFVVRTLNPSPTP